MTRLAFQLPEYKTVHAMYGVGETTAAQLMAEISDVRRFPRRISIVGFAGVDPGVDESVNIAQKAFPQQSEAHHICVKRSTKLSVHT